MDSIIGFIGYILDWLELGQYGFFEEFIAYVIIKITTWKIAFMLWSLQFSWSIAEQVLIQLSVGDQIEAIWAATDSVVLSWLSFFKVPQALNLILTAGTTKFVMRMVGF